MIYLSVTEILMESLKETSSVELLKLAEETPMGN